MKLITNEQQLNNVLKSLMGKHVAIGGKVPDYDRTGILHSIRFGIVEIRAPFQSPLLTSDIYTITCEGVKYQCDYRGDFDYA